MLPASSLSLAAYGLRDRLIDSIEELTILDDVKIGHPGDTMMGLDISNENRLNLFIYNVNYDGFPADGSSDNPFYVRMHCLITAIGCPSTDPEELGGRDISRGENELRLIGEVMRVLHQEPNISIKDTDANLIAALQVVPLNINLDNLNHIWSTQNDISYRLSVAYELALAPVPLTLPKQFAPVTAENNFKANSDMDKYRSGKVKDPSYFIPRVDYIEIDIEEDTDYWVPQICYMEDDDGETHLHYVYNYPGALDQELSIYVAGRDGGSVKMYWDVWRRRKDNNKAESWKEEIADSIEPLDKAIEKDGGENESYAPQIIDPNNIDARKLISVKLPELVRDSNTQSWQALLYAIRVWNHKDPLGSGDDIETKITSNTVLFTGRANG